jgi:PhnB protein
MLRTTPFLLFDGNCAEAMTFYHKCLGGELTLTKLGDTPLKDTFPEEKWGRLINAHLKNGAYGQFIDKYGVVWQFKGDKKE